MNNYQIHYFGLLGERRGLAEETIQSVAATARELYGELDAAHGLGMSLRDLRVAVNDEIVSWDQVLRNADYVAFLPPMSGG